MQRLVRLASLLLIVTLSACNKRDVLPSQSSSTSTIAPAITITHTPTPILTPDFTSTPILIPDFLDSSVAQKGFLLSSSGDPDCQLPCWQGLRVGESHSTDVQRMFEDIYGFDSAWDIFEHPEIVESAVFSSQLDLPDMRAGGYRWNISRADYGSASFETFAVVERQTDILQGIRLNYDTGIQLGTNAEGQGKVVSGTEAYQSHTVGQTIRVLGAPDAMYFDTRGGFEMMLIYKRGIVSSSFTIEPKRNAVANGISGDYQEFCLDGPLIGKTEFIIAPFDLEKPDELTVLQQRWIIDSIRADGLTSLEELEWTITKDEIVEAAMTQDNLCLLFGPINE